MRKIIIILFVFCTTGMLFAQDNFKQGYIIKNERDTINGWVDFRTVKINNQQCKFRLTEDGETTTYLPGEIIGYRFQNEGKYYISKNIEIEGVKQMVFLEYLLSGLLDLYLYEETSTSFYFFEDQEGNIFPVEKSFNDGNRVIEDEDGRRRYSQQNFKYAGMLRYIFKDCEPVVKKVGKNSYKEENIIKLTKEYHGLMCGTGEECIIFEGKRDKKYVNIKFAPYVGWASQSYTFLIGGDSKGSDISSVIMGGEFNMVIPRWNKNISIIVDLSATKMKKDFPRAQYSNTIIKMESWVFDMKMGLRYQFDVSKRFKPTVDGGFLVSYVTNSSSNKVGDVAMSQLWGNMNYLMAGYSFGIGLNVMTIKDQYLFVRADYRGRKGPYYDISGFRLCTGYAF